MHTWFIRLWGLIGLIVFVSVGIPVAFAQTPDLELVVICGTATPPEATPDTIFDTR